MGRLTKLLKHSDAWASRHTQALDVGFIVFLSVALIGNLRSYLANSPWGWIGLGLITVGVLMRLWALAWRRGYLSGWVDAAHESEALIAEQQAVIKLQQANIEHVSIPTVAVEDDGHGQQTLTFRARIHPN